MAKKAKAPAVEVVSEVTLTSGAVIKGFSDGSFKFYPAPIELTAEDVQTIFGSEDSGDDSEEEDDDEVSIEDMKAALLESGMTKKELKKLSDEEIEEAYGDLESDDSEEEEEEEEEEDSDDDDDDSDDSDDDDSEEDSDDSDEEVTAEDLLEMDFEDLEDLCDDQELDIDPDDYEEDQVDKLRKAVAKELGITLPSAGKKKKK